jgi:SAM-dependent methyltransferase
MSTATPASPALTIDRQYGAVLEGRWVPAPRFVLRRDRVLPLVEGLPAGRVIEVGCGSGALLRELAQRGHDCVGLETSPDAVEVAGQMLADFPKARVLAQAEPGWEESFDLLMAFEVLEHIEDDRGALKDWVRWLRPGGKVILSMPAHMAMWSQRDAWAGHYRRYGRDEMVRLAEAAGLKIDKLECYGFPLSNLTHWLGNVSVRGQDFAGGGMSQEEATAASGTDRTAAIKYFPWQRSLLGRAIMGTACQIQRPFLGTQLGDGYLLVATKR